MRIGILGGTFDPVHEGHYFVARRLRELLRLDRVLFMVVRFPTHRGQRPVSSAFHRYAMCALRVSHSRHLFASQWELLQEHPSYTVDTLRHFVHRYPQHDFCFLAGSDSLRELSSWKNYDKLLTEYCLVFVQRPGAETALKEVVLPSVLKKRIHGISEHAEPDFRPGRSYLVQLKPPGISSSHIRRLIWAGKRPSKHSLAPAVYRYIRKYRLYEPNHKDIEDSLPGS